LGDLSGDGGLDVVVGSDDGFVYALDGLNGSLLWKVKTYPGDSSPILGDVDGDGLLDVITGSYYLYVIDHRGYVLWMGSIVNDVAGSPILGDLNGDDKLDVVFLVKNGYLYVLGHIGNLLTKYQIGGDTYSSPVLGDLDGDGGLELVAVDSYHGVVYAFDFPGAGFLSYWSCFRGDSLHTGNVLLFDSDGDMLSDSDEVRLGTDPDNPDTDGDGLPDGYEVFHDYDCLSSSWFSQPFLFWYVVPVLVVVAVFASVVFLFLLRRRYVDRERSYRNFSLHVISHKGLNRSFSFIG
ncbi:MAG: hypothetical protein ACP6IP_09260, partial [Candidatus Njordarchaeia archaeon]